MTREWLVLAAVGFNVLAGGLNIAGLLRGRVIMQRTMREVHMIRTNALSLAKQAIDAGAVLEPRCIFCVSVLPNHVEHCIGDDYTRNIKTAMDWFMERLTRPRQPVKIIKAEKPEVYVRDKVS